MQEQQVCRICRTFDPDKPLKTPCLCTGSIKYVHSDCLIEWINYSKKEVCHVCKQKYRIQKTFAELTYFELLKHIIQYIFYGVNVGMSLMLWFIGFPVFVNLFFTFYGLQPYSYHKFSLSEFARAYYYGVFQTFLLLGFWMTVLSLRDIVNDYLDIRRLRQAQQRQQQQPQEPMQEPLELMNARERQEIQDELMALQNLIVQEQNVEGVPPNRQPGGVVDQAFGNREEQMVQEQVAQMFNEPPRNENDLAIARDDNGEWLNEVFGFGGNFLMSAFYEICAIVIAFSTVFAFIYVPNVIGSLLATGKIPHVLDNPTSTWMILWHVSLGYLSSFIIIILIYVGVKPLRNQYRDSFSAIFLAGKVIFLFILELIVFPILVGFLIRVPLNV